MDYHLGSYQKNVDDRIATWNSENFLKRLWQKDPSLWFPSQTPELSDRLGWLFLPEYMLAKLDELKSFAEEIQAAGYRYVILLGMGGSSLSPEVFQSVLGNAPGYPQLLVLDSTHPLELLDVREQVDLSQTLILVSSKSGTTLETLSLFRFFWDQMKEEDSAPERHFVVITDPGSPLESLAKTNKFRRIFLTPEDVGGRYSAYSYFGMVPAALIGSDFTRLLNSARSAAEQNSDLTQEFSSPGIVLGAILGEVGIERNTLTLLTSSGLRALPDWLEQLIAESTGKAGQGIIPVVNEPLQAIEDYGKNRCFVFFLLQNEDNSLLHKQILKLKEAGHPVISFTLESGYEIAQQMYHWEIAISAASSVLGVHPFNQPDVHLSKQLTRDAMKKTSKIEIKQHDSVFNSRDRLIKWLEQSSSGEYLAIQAFLPRNPIIRQKLLALRTRLFRHTGLATTLGYGPRFLHSTGQLHKGGPNTGSFIQMVDDTQNDMPVPDTNYTFADLIKAQAQGDFLALKQRNRRIIQLNLGTDIVQGLDSLLDLL